MHEKAAVLLHSVVPNHPLADGNKRLGLASVIAFYGMNGFKLTFTNDEAYELVMAVTSGELDDVAGIADRLAAGVLPDATELSGDAFPSRATPPT